MAERAKKSATKKRPPAEVYSLRLRPELLERADRLVDILNESDAVTSTRASGIVDKATVLRLAIERGLAQLETEYPAARPPTRKARRLPE
jgi:predicted DNA-binding protein